MAATNYTYLITDTANNKVAHDALDLEIQQEAGLTIKLLSSSDDGTNITLTFAAPVPAIEKSTYLDSIISAHTGETLEYAEKIEEVITFGGKKVANEGFSFTATAGQITTYNYKFNYHILVGQGFMHTENQHIKDNITLELTDVDNVLGYGAGFVLHAYCREYPVSPNGTTVIKNKAYTESDLKYLYMVVKYESFGTTDVDCNCGIDGRLP